MPKPATGTLWLVLALLSGLLALGVLAFGILSIFHTHGNVRMHEAAAEKQLAQLRELQREINAPGNRARLNDTIRMLEVISRHRAEDRSYRLIAFLIAGSSFLPGLLAIVFFVIFFIQRRRSNNETEPSERKKARRN